jgi:cytoskeletal protein RodZ
MQTHAHTPKIMLILMMIIATIVGGFGVNNLIKMQSDAASAETTMAQVVSFEMSKPTSGGGWSRYPVVEFTTQSGQQIVAKARTSSDDEIGQTVRVQYAPSQPDRPQLPDATAFWLVPWSAAIVGFLGLIMSVVLWRRDGRPFGNQG